MKALFTTAGVLLLATGSIAFAQAPATKPTIPQVCTNCHQAKPANVQGYFENVAFKSKSIHPLPTRRCRSRTGWGCFCHATSSCAMPVMGRPKWLRSTR